MAWFSGKVSLGNFPDFAEAVSKISEGVKSIEKNFDNALGLEENPDGASSTSAASGLWSTDIMSFMGQQDEDGVIESSEDLETSEKHESLEKLESLGKHESSENHESASLQSSFRENEMTEADDQANLETLKPEEHQGQPLETNNLVSEEAEKLAETNIALPEGDSITEKPVGSNIGISEEATTATNNENEVEASSIAESSVNHPDQLEFPDHTHYKESPEFGFSEDLGLTKLESRNSEDQVFGDGHQPNEVDDGIDLQKTEEETMREVSGQSGHETHRNEAQSDTSDEVGVKVSDDSPEMVLEVVNTCAKVEIVDELASEHEADKKEQSLGSNLSDDAGSVVELEKVKKEMKLMETALLGAARQAQAKADEIAKLMNENEQLKSVLEDQKRKSNEAEIESLREEYHQRVSTLERKVYALTRERDTLRREQNKKSDAAALLKEKDEIITQVMAEGEELSKKQAAQESQIRKLRAQIREFEEEKKGLIMKLQVEENKVETIKRDKVATEKLLQETIEKNQAELATQKEFYTNALSAAKEAEALAEARANDEARSELESRLKEAAEREAMLVQTLEELRQTLSRSEQQAVFREDMLRRDVEDLQKRYQASERRCEELITQVPESTRPLLRQIEAIQETTARRVEAWNAVERSLNSRLQEAEAKAAGSEERERSVSERLSQTLSRLNVLEAQISCLRTEQTQLTRSLEKERQRAAESRQDYLALKEETYTHEGHVNQLEEEIRELKRKHKQELQEALTHRELLQQDIEREKAARLELEKTASAVPEQNPIARTKSSFENGLSRRLSSAGSLSSMEESFYLQASLDSSDNFSERRNLGESTYYLKSKTPNAFEAALRQKEGELASYMSRLASMESIRDSLAEELVKMTGECEKLRSEVGEVGGLKAELEALRKRHSAALELMGERDEELEELRADIVDLKEMYREQVNILVNKIQVLSSSIAAGA
ncbi:golgin candidate 5-like [Cynara cardunculus var. scolymus]|uniref:golgin candidate 5-like n=1 Tax=Cynara cardunculus var. scolymus TaxID=59895 RepID=UPI000D6266C9|nr:golgin candidate 5-like [Cynara cardunculus var. scolymus]